MNNRPLTIVILAAGMGTRLGDLTQDTPKALTMVSKHSILSYAVGWAMRFSPTKIVIVGGFLIDQIRQAAAQMSPLIEVVENPEYATTQRLYSFLKARNVLHGDVMVFDGDYVYHNGIQSVVTQNMKNVCIFVTHQQSADVTLDMHVQIDENRNLVTMSKELSDFSCYFNSLFFCESQHVSDFLDTADTVISQKGSGSAHLEDAIIEYARTRHPVRAVDAGAPTWIEIDNPHELSIAEQMISSNPWGFTPII